LYIVSGLPIVCRVGTADADILSKYKIGKTVNNLKDIDLKLSVVTEEEYQNFKNNILELAEKCSTGYFLKWAVIEILIQSFI